MDSSSLTETHKRPHLNPTSKELEPGDEGLNRVFLPTVRNKDELQKAIRTMWLEYKTEEVFNDKQSAVIIDFACKALEQGSAWMRDEMAERIERGQKRTIETVERLSRGVQQLTANITTLEAKSATTGINSDLLSYASICKSTASSSSQSGASASVPLHANTSALVNAKEKACYTVLQSVDNEANSDKTIGDWKKVLARRQQRENLKLVSVEKTKANNLTVRFDNPSERKRFEQSLAMDPIKGAKLRSSAERKVVFAMRGIPGHYTKEQLSEEIIARNPEFAFLSASTTTIEDSRKLKDGEIDNRTAKTFKLITDVQDAKALADQKFLYISLQRIRLSLWTPNRRCGNCHDENHTTRDCKSKPVCRICSGSHASFHCSNRGNSAAYNCIVCKRLGKPSNHKADSDGCEVIRKEVEGELNQTCAMILANHG